MVKRIILTGGGTAGHVTPHLALIPRLKELNYDIAYIGSQDGIEKTIIEQAGIPYYSIPTGKLRRYFSLKNFSDPFKVIAGVSAAKKLLDQLKPNVVFSKGGFVSLPVVYAAAAQNIPVVTHESDYTPGLANKLIAKKADVVCVSFRDTIKFLEPGKGVYTGTPVRPELFKGDKKIVEKNLGFSLKPNLLVMGGSQGAQRINEVVEQSLDELLLKFNIIHIRGKGNLNKSIDRKGYYQVEYVTDQLKDYYAAADIMVSRAGANSVFEILALNIPALLIPLGGDASRGDQILNAEYCGRNGYCHTLLQDDLTPETFVSAVKSLYQNKKECLKELKTCESCDAVSAIVEQIEKAAK